MNKHFIFATCLIFSLSSVSAQTFIEDVSVVKKDVGTIFLGITGLGLKSWNWGSQKKFKTQSEGWFGDNTHSGGMDKLGHSFSSYLITDYLTDRFEQKGYSLESAALNSTLIAQGLMLYVEVFDGFSSDHGFSKEDLVMNMIGSGLSYARTTNPKLKDLVDFRIEYQKSYNSNFAPISDYEGQKYLLAWKLSGIDYFKNTPLKYIELHTGYYARGFKKKSIHEKSRENFIGISINLNEIFFKNNKESIKYKFFEYVQVPNLRIE